MRSQLKNLSIQIIPPSKNVMEWIRESGSSYQKTMLAFSFMTPNASNVSRQISEIHHTAKHHLTHITLIAGGAHPSGAPAHTLAMGFDIVVVGEGEITFPELLIRWMNGEDYSQINGIVSMQNGELQYSGPSSRVMDLDIYPPFAIDLGLLAPIEITRGCPWNCRFCQTSHLMGTRQRHRSIDNIVHWAEVFRSHGRGFIRFISSDALSYGSDKNRQNLGDVTKLLQAISGIIDRNQIHFGSFPSEVRPNSVTPEALELIRTYTGTRTLVIGGQSGSQRILELAHRGHSVEDIYRAVKLTLKAGLAANVDFIFGMPGETPDDISQTIRVISDITSMGATIHSHTFMPLAGTSWAELPGSSVDPRIRNLLEKLAGTRKQSGQWRRQERIAHYLRNHSDCLDACTDDV